MAISAIIDQAIFSKLLESMGSDVDFLNELVEAYLASTPELLTSMQQALATGDAPALQRSAHSLKSGSASFGATAFAALCKDLEDIGKSGALTAAAEKITAIEAAYPQVAAGLQDCVHTARTLSG